MRLVFTLFFLLLLGYTAEAQKLTGIWRGYFSSANPISREGREEMYKYEIQISQQTNDGVKGVTFSYKSTLFYGKASLTGIYTAATKSLILRETKLVELKVAGQSEPCLMTCYLDYSKIGKLEVLQGTFISINAKDKGDCGSGKVYLERVTTSDFKKEDFLEKMKDIDSAKHLPDNAKASPSKPAEVKPPVKQQPVVKPPVTDNTVKSQKAPDKPATTHKPSTNNSTRPADTRNKPLVHVPDRIPETSVASPRSADTAPAVSRQEPPAPVHRNAPLPKVLTERENSLVKTIIVDEEEVQIDLVDNGTIDNDSISVYDNNVLVVSKARLTYTAITIKFRFTKEEPRHEIIVVAENLGDIPPNSALMIINPRSKKHPEVFVTSTEERNAKVIIEYRPKGSN